MHAEGTRRAEIAEAAFFRPLFAAKERTYNISYTLGQFQVIHVFILSDYNIFNAIALPPFAIMVAFCFCFPRFELKFLRR
ncbi:hypothetical protein AL013_01530 [Mariprofundus ferrooxydans]|uniref:Uncharacterized protein n=1 Tax=Mariprofundus ferrooxydans PV-1 TaxID=314345 RepID=Q0F2G7_9PROT|nr:hypothetical protein SPV1_01507 [Mariprofundus ferrooxydans PV-1]KON48678.1 hypothetical protein AL013_01530 [Mariprofundus ferrooxydans]